MNINEYLERDSNSQTRLSSMLDKDHGPGATQGAISQWTKLGVPPGRWTQMERVSEGEMTMRDLADEYDFLQQKSSCA